MRGLAAFALASCLPALACFDSQDAGGGDADAAADVAPDAVVGEVLATGPSLQVTPASYQFGPILSVGTQKTGFTIRNLGTAPLVIYGVAFQQPTNAFMLMNVPKVGTQIDPDGWNTANGPVTFQVLYAPTTPPDVNAVVITSNDELQPEFVIPLKGDLELGEPSVTWADPGCVDFTTLVTAAQSCTKVIHVANVGKGALTLDRPSIVASVSDAYSLEWFHGGGAQAASCGPHNGNPISPTQAQSVLAAGASVDVAVTYVAPGAQGQNASLALTYTTPFPGTFEVPLCGGAAKGEFDVAPPSGDTMYFFAGAAQAKQKTFVILNKGNGTLLIHGVTFVKLNETDPDGVFSLQPPVGEFTMGPWSLLPVTVQFSTSPGFPEPILNGRVDISYRDPLTEADQVSSYNLVGHNDDFAGVTLPVAHAVAVPANPKVGQQLTLDASGSTGGTFPLWTQGFTWFVSNRPAASRVFLDHADGAAQVSLTPDVAGVYEFRVYGFSTDGATAFYYSDEAVVAVVAGTM